MFLRSALLLYLITALLPTEGRKYTKSEELQEIEDFEEWRRFRRERKVIQEREGRYVPVEGTSYNFKNENPPPIDKVALMGRYIVNQADWTSVATISSREKTNSFPFVNIVSYSDGSLGNGSGIPYLFLTPLDFTAQDISKDRRATLMMTLAQGQYCKAKVWDPIDPRCARIILSGEIKPVKNSSAEYEYAKNAVFTRHPKLVNMPADHHFFFAKLDISRIAVLDTFGGAANVAVQDYLHPSTSDVNREFFRQFPIQEPLVTEIKGDDHYVDTNTL